MPENLAFSQSCVAANLTQRPEKKVMTLAMLHDSFRGFLNLEAGVATKRFSDYVLGLP